MDPELKEIIDRMIAAGESDADIGLVIQRYQPAGKTLEGFGQNVVESGKRFLTDTASGLYSLAQGANRVGRAVFSPTEAQSLAQDVRTMGQNAPGIVSGMGTALANRYGSPEAIANTLYTDPVGVASDISTVAGGVGLGAKIARAPGVVSLAQKVERATNPLTAITKPAAALAREAGIGAVQGTVRPGKRLRTNYGGGRAIAETIVDEGLTSEARAAAEATRSHNQADRLLANLDDQRPAVRGYLPAATEEVPLGVTPQPSGGQASVLPAEITQPRKVGPVGNVEELQQRRWTPVFGGQTADAVGDVVSGPGVVRRPMQAPGGPGAPPSMIDPREVVAAAAAEVRDSVGRRGIRSDALAQIDDLQQRFLADNPRPLMLTETNDIKRAEQLLSDAAYRSEAAGHPINAVEAQFRKALAKSLREAIEKKTAAVGPINQRTQRLMGAEQALADAEDRTHGLVNPMSVAAGLTTGAMTGDPLMGLAAGFTLRAADSPRLGTAVGVGLDRAGKAADSDLLRRILMASRLFEAPQ